MLHDLVGLFRPTSARKDPVSTHGSAPNIEDKRVEHRPPACSWRSQCVEGIPLEGSRSMQKKRVLVADGTAGGRELLRILLEHEGYEVFEASDSLEAVNEAQAILPDLILLDVDLPTAVGYVAVRQMRMDDRLKGRVIIALTAGSRRADREGLVKASFSGYLAKPVVLRVLREQLAQLG
jgi:two-component system cell cycle response regulator DivK